MCTICGCEEMVHDETHEHAHDHDHDHEHEHGDRTNTRTIAVGVDVLEKSRKLAGENRAWLAERGVFMVNVMAAPGAGKTTLLERVVKELGPRALVIEGDQATSVDADRIRAAGGRAVQVNTGTGCHLDPTMVKRALAELDPARGSVVIVENVGNLVCPALFDLGEAARVVLLSTPEGDDKPKKYPHMFASATHVLLTKTDLLPYVPFDVARVSADLHGICPRARVAELSARTGEGVGAFCRWLEDAAS